MEFPGKTTVLLTAKTLLASDTFGDTLLRKKALVLSPLPVMIPGGGLHSWWVPLQVKDRLVAFFQFQSDGTLMRFSAFQRQGKSFDACPALADWHDPDRIKSIALELIDLPANAQEPYLSYDGSPERLVWVVEITPEEAAPVKVYVAGNYAYRAPIR
jgi:hypothetical protein